MHLANHLFQRKSDEFLGKFSVAIYVVPWKSLTSREIDEIFASSTAATVKRTREFASVKYDV